MANYENKRLLSCLENSPTKMQQLSKKQRTETDGTNDNNNPSETITENYDFLLDDDDDFDIPDDYKQEQPKLNLNNWCRCIVKDIEREKKTYQLILRLHGEDNPSIETELRLQGPWCRTRVKTKDLVSVQAIWDDTHQCFKVDKDNGFIITNPDFLISGTSVVGALFCQRKGVLQDRFRGLEGNNKIMFIGSLVHEILQTVLAKSLQTRKDIENVAKEILESKQTMYTLYDCKMNRQEAFIEVQKFTENIFNFVQQYVTGKQPEMLPAGMFKEKIDQIKDIEENLWIPQLGLKGKVDVSVKIHRSSSRNVLPLELKTGRASFSLEHKGQLILYQMMLTAAGQETDSGLLLYLREGIMKEIHGTRNEKRDLIVLRNELSYFLTRYFDASKDKIQEYLALPEKKFEPFELPEPVSHPTACSNCAYATICSSFGKVDPSFDLSETHPLRNVSEATTYHLTDDDLSYFTKWCGLLSLEEQEAKKSNYLRSIWKDSPKTREKNGRAVTELSLKSVEALHEGRYQHCFHLKDNHDIDITTVEISLGEYVIVSSTKRVSIASGFVYDISQRTITINLERNLENNYKNQTFIVDKHESQSEQIFNYTNLGVLLDNSDNSNQLRSIIIQRAQPTFTKQISGNVLSETGLKLLGSLNSIQRKAAMAALTTDSFMLIKGLPGTGKTQTLVGIVRLLNLIGKTMIITSHTHSAVDNLLLRLKEFKDLKIIRLGSDSRVHPDLREYSERVHTAECRNEDDLAKVYSSFNIAAVTCLGAGHTIFTHRKFDYCIVDEATQVLQATVLRPLFFASKFILVGDPDQLPPLIRSKEARALGADESLFKRLDSTEATSVLSLQYRMNKTITRLANELTYNGELKCNDAKVSNGVMKLEKPITGSKWKQRALQGHIDQSVVFIDTLDCLERTNRFANLRRNSDEENLTDEDRTNNAQIFKYTNYCDAGVIFELVKEVLQTGFDGSRIGIIAPYRAQVDLLKRIAGKYSETFNDLGFANVEVNTVDQYQGRDKDVILYSCTRTGSSACKTLEKSKGVEILEDKRRLTVAITRSKHKLIIVGDSACLKQYTPFNELLGKIPSSCKLVLEDGRNGFSWESVLAGIKQVM
ncbi:DNA replication ATP-dependent helicase/nuclease DNA2 [Episyrphus balteatus]|uniref:DNA replication ATP-dependent helicase/nuclease DNA2 n=1 Tax=Episyrphus balteatus TaxID=286459 RepID=UPI0024854B6A|nr:DNA replication ATP-dependent helicase/nuclease DNA2 [Episyrphus balteatus]